MGLWILAFFVVWHIRLYYTQECRHSLTAEQFERQLQHLHFEANDIEFFNHTFSTTTDNAHCPNAYLDVSPMFQNERSLCPWDLVRDENENRYPTVLHYARCRCSRCLQGHGNYECKPVYYRIPLIEKRCINGSFQYIKSYLDLPVGCTCTKPRVISLSKRLSTLYIPRMITRALSKQKKYLNN